MLYLFPVRGRNHGNLPVAACMYTWCLLIGVARFFAEQPLRSVSEHLVDTQPRPGPLRLFFVCRMTALNWFRRISMPQACQKITRDISASLARLRAEAPEVMNGCELAAVATRDDALDKKTKERSHSRSVSRRAATAASN